MVASRRRLAVTGARRRQLRARTARVIRTLKSAYGRPRPGARKDPLSELIFTILSQNTSDLNRDRAWAALWKAFGSWKAIAEAPRQRLQHAIQVGGLAPTKSRVIQQVLRRVRADQGRYALDRLEQMPMEGVEAYLRGFKGVGVKTIRCVQVFSLGLPAFPVDTHIFRITKRLGLVPATAGPEAADRIMQSLTPPADVLPFHLNLIAHGRRVCKASRPLCEGCPLRRLCPHGRARRARPG